MWDNYKERRYAALFFGTFLALIGLIVLIGLSQNLNLSYNLVEDLPIVLPVAGMVTTLAIWWGMHWEKKVVMPPARNKTSILSRDELSKARSKLMKQSTLRKS